MQKGYLSIHVVYRLIACFSGVKPHYVHWQLFVGGVADGVYHLEFAMMIFSPT